MSNKNDHKIQIKTISKNQKLSSSKCITLVKKIILGVGVTNDTEKNILEYIIDAIANSSENFYIVTPNPEIITFSKKNIEFKKVLNEAKIALCDGIGLWLSSKILGIEIKERISGVDFMERLCEMVSKQPITIGFLGGRPGVAERTSECLKVRFTGLKVVFTGEEWNRDNKIKIDILFVAFGFPKQELWMKENINKINVRVMMGVGGAFDYLSGEVARAPKMVRNIGFEWLYRLIMQPWRWKRQLSLFEFAFLIIKEKFL